MNIKADFPYEECSKCGECIIDVKQQSADGTIVLTVSCKKKNECRKGANKDA